MLLEMKDKVTVELEKGSIFPKIIRKNVYEKHSFKFVGFVFPFYTHAACITINHTTVKSFINHIPTKNFLKDFLFTTIMVSFSQNSHKVMWLYL